MSATVSRFRPGYYQRGEETRGRILEAALELFAASGFEGASTRTIAERAGVNLPAIQYYFGSKEGLYRAVVEQFSQEMQAGVAPIAERIRTELAAGQPSRRQLVGLLCDMLDIVIALILDDSVPNRESRQKFFARMEVEPNAAVDALQDDMVRQCMQPVLRHHRPPDRSSAGPRAGTAARDDDHRAGQNLLRMGDQSGSPLGDDWRSAHTVGAVRCTAARTGDISRHAEQMIVTRTASLGAVTIALAIGGCAVGPDFHRPPAPTDAGYTPEPLATQTASVRTRGGEAQHFLSERDIPGDWWTLFHSEPLNRLIEQALKANPDLDAAQAALRQAQENVYAGEGALFPQASVSFQAGRKGSRVPHSASRAITRSSAWSPRS